MDQLVDFLKDPDSWQLGLRYNVTCIYGSGQPFLPLLNTSIAIMMTKVPSHQKIMILIGLE